MTLTSSQFGENRDSPAHALGGHAEHQISLLKPRECSQKGAKLTLLSPPLTVVREIF